MKSSPSAPPVVLLIDDSRDGLLVRRALLEEQGYQVQIASNGEDGLKLFIRTAFDVVVTDYRMPVMTGLELIRRIREVRPATPVVLLSGVVEPLGLTEANTGADAVIAKNNTEATNLIRSVRRLINRPPARKPAMSQRRVMTVRARA
jgi:CheY-like chemotaxis protein